MSALTRRQQIELQLWTALIAARVPGEIPAQSANIHTIAADILRGDARKVTPVAPHKGSRAEPLNDAEAATMKLAFQVAQQYR